jgi:predicted TIM-barrel fold metal-dependent hydrolase
MGTPDPPAAAMIDAHIHAVPPQIPGAGDLSPALRQPPDKLADLLREQMRLSGTTHALAMGEWRITPDDPLGVNRTLAVAALVPGLLAIGVMDPTKDKDDHDHFRRVAAALAGGRVAALKGYLGYLHYGPDHPTYRRYYELAARHRVPVVFHTGDTYSPFAKLKYAHPLGVDEVAVDHPDTRFVLAHVGNPWTLDAAEVIYKNVNVWADLSGLVVGDGSEFGTEAHLDALVDLIDRVRKAFRYAERPNRFVYGTDWPLIPMRPYRDFIAGVIPAECHDLVFAENAAMLFRLG